MVTFVVLNTASLQLIPTTIAALRLEMGSQAPWIFCRPYGFLLVLHCGSPFASRIFGMLTGGGKKEKREKEAG